MATKAVIPQPQGLEFDSWAALVVEALASLGVQVPISEDRWREWGCSLLYFPELATLPTPEGFATWRDWADRVTETTI